MRKRFSRGCVSVVGAALGAAAAVWGISRLIERFKQETEDTIRALESRSQVIKTAAGPVEVSINGEGPPVLVIHGAAGGYDQAEIKSEEFTGVQYIAVSRPGYLRTPLSTGETPAEQADALAALLDSLGIEKAGVIGTSTGGLVGMYFALRHPERCAALVLVSSVNAPLPNELSQLSIFSPLLENNFLSWTFRNPEGLLLIDPVLRKQVASDPEKIEVLGQIVQTTYPTSLRLSGMLNDAHQIDNLEEIPLESIRVPTLVIHGTADSVVPFSHGVRSASRIPGARFLPVFEGTHHAILTHLEITRPAIMDFLKDHMPE